MLIHRTFAKAELFYFLNAYGVMGAKRVELLPTSGARPRCRAVHQVASLEEAIRVEASVSRRREAPGFLLSFLGGLLVSRALGEVMKRLEREEAVVELSVEDDALLAVETASEDRRQTSFTIRNLQESDCCCRALAAMIRGAKNLTPLKRKLIGPPHNLAPLPVYVPLA